MEKPNPSEVNKGNELKKELGLKEAIAIVIGVVIGSGVFFKPAIVFGSAGAPGLGIFAWIVGGIITIAAGLTVAEIAAAIPKTGGLFIYLKELYGEKWAFLLGWVQSLVYIPGASAALAIVFATQTTTFIDLNAFQQKLLAAFIIIFIAIVNLISTKFSGRFQLFSTVGKLIPIIVIILCGLIMGKTHNFTPFVSNTSTASGFGAAILGTLWAYDGWINVGNISGELKNPAKDLPKSIIIGLLTVMLVYVTINIAVINTLPMSVIVASKKPVSDAAVALLGHGGAAFISIGILISIIGALNGYLITGVRMPYAMAKDGLLPFSNILGKLDEKRSTPINALIFEIVLAMLYVFTGSFDMITNLVVFVLWIFFTMAVVGIFILRTKRKDLVSDYKVPLYPIIPIIGVVGGVFILLNTLVTSTQNALFGIGITIIGIPVYVYLAKKKILSSN